MRVNAKADLNTMVGVNVINHCALIFLIEWQPSETDRVFFEKTSKGKTPNIAFTGMPFYQLGFKRLVCHQGKDLNVNAKKKYAEEAGKVGTITSF